MVTTKSIRWDEVPGFSELSEDTRKDFNKEDILDIFISRSQFNPTNIDAYISPREELIYLIYYREDRIELVRTLPDSDENREYTIMRLS